MNDDLARIRGPVMYPGHEGFDGETSGYNLLIRHQPALVVGATGTADVMAAVRFAAGRGMPVAIQATGATGGVCLNFLTGPEVTTDVLRSAYLPADFERLTALKKHYDPQNMFRINHNIPPREERGAGASNGALLRRASELLSDEGLASSKPKSLVGHPNRR